MFYKVKSVMPMESYKLLVTFLNGTTKEYDVSSLFDELEPFQAIKHVSGLFNLVQVDLGGYGISWNDELDLSCDELWENGKDIAN